ncbi:MAG: hypothetical protein H0X41_11100, partial [Chitinophagaceae bacterium]|nr:hypothetical protein [Chitinophagaceae bacterium]
MTDPTQFYSSRINTYTARLKAVRQRSVYTSAARFIAFVLLAACIYFYFQSHSAALLTASFSIAVLFIVLIRLSVSLTEKKHLLTKLLFINKNEVDVLNYKDNAFDDGSAITGLEMHASDLDIFGRRSVYHLLNRTTTVHGAESLSGLLNHPFTTQESILAYQQAITQFSSSADTRQLITAHGLMQDKDISDINEIVQWIETPEKIAKKKWIQLFRFLLPMVAVAGLLLYLSNNNPLVLGTAIIVNWLLIGTFARYILEQHTLIGKKEAVLQQYGAILKIFSKADAAQSTVLNALKATAGNARHEIPALSRLSGLFDQRLNLLVSIFLNSFLLYDIHVMIALENWKRKNRKHFTGWIAAVGEIEKLNSLATFHFNNPEYFIPNVLTGKPFIQATALAHP